ncbi:MAG: NUDIX domain-containing protein [Comamonadaceae bacterium]|nr:NUDIX domain-containing protein [Comamonadaceae bacterium]
MPHILTLPRLQAPSLPQSGCWPVTTLDFMHPPLWRVRAEVEQDESLLQPIAYLVLLNKAGQAWCYQRAGGDARVDGRWSCGVGGHVDLEDAADTADALTQPPFHPEATLRRALQRELAEELQASADDLQDLRQQGLIYERISPIGRVHLGVLYTAQWFKTTPPEPRAGETLRAQGFMTLRTIATDSRFELWSQLAAKHLSSTPP